MTFVLNWTARSASDLLADLNACRQLRHTKAAQRESVVRYFFGDVENALKEKKRLPRVHRYFVWTYEAFEVAFAHFGCSCDCCPAIVDVDEKQLRRSADRALDNLDGRVRLMLCIACSRHFTRFCSRYFDQEVRVPFDDGLERMMVAWLAFEVRQNAKRFINACNATPHDRPHSGPDAPGRNHPQHSAPNGRGEKHRREVPDGFGRSINLVSLREACSSPGLVLGTIPKVDQETSVHAQVAQPAGR